MATTLTEFNIPRVCNVLSIIRKQWEISIVNAVFSIFSVYHSVTRTLKTRVHYFVFFVVPSLSARRRKTIRPHQTLFGNSGNSEFGPTHQSRLEAVYQWLGLILWYDYIKPGFHIIFKTCLSENGRHDGPVEIRRQRELCIPVESFHRRFKFIFHVARTRHISGAEKFIETFESILILNQVVKT